MVVVDDVLVAPSVQSQVVQVSKLQDERDTWGSANDGTCMFPVWGTLIGI